MSLLHFPQSKPSVLVLNDSSGTIQVLSDALESVGFEVRGALVADSGQVFSGNDSSPSFAPDVIVYDIGRGGNEEWADLRAFTELAGAKGKPLVITTTNVIRVEGQRDAVYVRSHLQFVSTPFDMTDLTARVSAAIGLSPVTEGTRH